MPPFDDRVELDELKRQLDDHAKEIAHHLYGEPTMRRRNEYRWGRCGSVQLIRRNGRWRWHNHETGEHGGVLDAIMSAQGLNFAGAVRWAREWLSVGDATMGARPRRATPPIDVDEELERRCRQAVRIWHVRRPAAGTRADRYLRQHRTIDAEFPSDAVGFVTADDVRRCRPQWPWWRWPALVVAATDAAGNVTGVQLTALEADGSAALRAEGGGKLKLSLGKLAGSAVRLRQCVLGHNGGSPLDATAPLQLGEGFETAASAWWAAGFEAWALLGSIAKADLSGVPVTRPIVILGDDDKRDAASNKALKDAILRWRREGRTVLVVKPWRLTRGDKSDFNDLLRAEGRDAVRERIVGGLVPAMSEPMLPSVDNARREAAHAIGTAIRDLRQWWDGQTDGDADDVRAPLKVVRAMLGLGKTRIAIEHVVDVAAQGERVAYLGPTHAFGAEMQQRFEAEFVRQGCKACVEIWRGREAASPENPGEAMCAELDTVREAQAAHLDVEQVVCEVCPHREHCPYLAQRTRSADVWIGAHELLLNPLPTPLKDTTLVVIDEGFAGRIGFIGLNVAHPLLLTRDDILAEPSLTSMAATADLLASLMPLRRKFAVALDGHPAGGLDRERLLAAGLTADEAAKARRIEWRAKVEPDINERTTWPEAKKRIGRAAKANKDLGRQDMAWREVEALLRDEMAIRSGRATWGMHATDHGATFAALRLYGIDGIDEAWLKVPTLHLDATANMTLLQVRMPHAELVADITAAAPHMRVVQLVGKTFGKGALRYSKTLNKAWCWAVAHATRRGGDWLVVMPKDAEKAITGTRTVPPFIRLAHFGALRGLDAHKDATGIIIIGRPMPPPADVERLVGILSRHEVRHRVEGWYPGELGQLRGKDGTAATVEADRHPDALVEAVRAAIAEAELLQAIGRARGINRTADNPVEVVLIGGVPIPGLVLDSVQPWQAPSVDDEILADHGVQLDAAADAATVAGLTLRAVELRRARLPSFSYKGSLYENEGNLREVVYQLAGAGHHRHRMAYDPRRVADIRGFLEAGLGTLAAFELVDERPTTAATAQADIAVVETVAEPVAVMVPLIAALPELEPVAAAGGVWSPAATTSRSSPAVAYTGGLLPIELSAWSREQRRAAGYSQAAVARQIGISRPQLANAEAGRFGLSPETAAHFLATVASLPVRQPLLL